MSRIKFVRRILRWSNSLAHLKIGEIVYLSEKEVKTTEKILLVFILNVWKGYFIMFQSLWI